MNFNEVMQEARALGEGATVGVVVVSNQDDGIASYATGRLRYFPGFVVVPTSFPERLSTTRDSPLKYLFSDRTLRVGETRISGGFDDRPIQPFSILEGDDLGLLISQESTTEIGRPLNPVVNFTLQTWGDVTFRVTTQPIGNLLVGIGSPVGNRASEAVYLVAFTDVLPPVQPPR